MLHVGGKEEKAFAIRAKPMPKALGTNEQAVVSVLFWTLAARAALAQAAAKAQAPSSKSPSPVSSQDAAAAVSSQSPAAVISQLVYRATTVNVQGEQQGEDKWQSKRSNPHQDPVHDE